MDSWDEFVASHLRQQPVLTSYSDSSIKKIGNNLIKALAEAGYLDTPRRRNLQSVFLLPETQASLAAPWTTRTGFYSGGATVIDPVLEYRLSQVQSRIRAKNASSKITAPVMRLGSGFLIIPLRMSCRCVNI
jgi:DNA-directed RNA polymerase specialized sigma54-like protein